MQTLVDGVAEEVLPISDRGLHYGDGLFETIAVREGRLEFWQRHMARLEAGCRRLHIPPPEPEALLDDARKLFAPRVSGVLKIIITRGSGGRGYRLPEPQQPRRIVSAHPWPDYPDSLGREGIEARFCRTRLGTNPQLAGLKHLNRLEQVLARNEWHAPGVHEGLMFNADGYLVEGVMSNLFLVHDGAITTPDLSNCGVAGIIRQVVLEIAQALDLLTNISSTVTTADVSRASELFVTNSLVGIWPLRTVAGQHFRVGEMTRTIQAELERRQKQESHSIS